MAHACGHGGRVPEVTRVRICDVKGGGARGGVGGTPARVGLLADVAGGARCAHWSLRPVPLPEHVPLVSGLRGVGSVYTRFSQARGLGIVAEASF
jgi:hypothetical protein